MTSQIGEQIITIHILPSISRIKGNQAIKFEYLIRYNLRNIFLKVAESEAERLVPNLFLLFRKASCKLKAHVQHLSCSIFW